MADDPRLPLADPGLGEPSEPRRTLPRGPIAVLAVVLLLGTGSILGMYFQGPLLHAFFRVSGLEPGAGARDPIALPAPRVEVPLEPDRDGEVVALARLRPRDGVLALGAPVGSGDARIRALRVDEGDVVEAGQVLVELDTLPSLEAAVQSAAAQVEVREASLRQVQRDVSVGRAENQAAIEAARVALEQAKREQERTRTLFGTGAATQAQLEAADTTARTSALELERLQAASGRFTRDDVKVAERNLEAARAELARAELDRSRGQVVAPMPGTVLEVLARPGERIGPTLLTLGDVGSMEAELEVFQSAVGRVVPGQRVLLESEVFDAPLTARVHRVGREVGRQQLTGDDPAANTDARVVRVIVVLDPEASERAAGFVGLEMVARIEVGT